MIQIHGVRKAFGTQLVLDGVDLDIPQGAVVSIIGPSGSGKSTLLRVIDYLESADAGTIDFGQGSISWPVHSRRTSSPFVQESDSYSKITIFS